MKFRHLYVSILALWVLLSNCESPERRPVVDKPNILWITVEDISPRLGCYGDANARTPVLDQLAREGMRFVNAFTTAGVCAPSRSAIITGMFQNSIGTHHMRTTHKAEGLPTPYFAVPPPQVKAFTEYLRMTGYYCTNNSKTDYQFGVPVTAWDESSKTAHWRNRGLGQPFFAVFNLATTHESRVWPVAGQDLVTDPTTLELPPYYPDTINVREDLARHYDNIAKVDGQIGDILQQLDDDGLAENTAVFFFSDHGDGLPRAKRWLYDSGLRVPMIVRWPNKLPKSSVSQDLVSCVDLAPTLLSMAGVEIPEHMQGQPFLGARKAAPRKYIFAARDRIDESYDWVRAVRDKRHKLIRNYYPDLPYVLPVAYRDRGLTMQDLLRLDREGKLEGPQKLWMSKNRPPEELYDLEADPHEIENLIDQPAMRAVADRLRQALDSWIVAVDDKGSVPESEMVASMWPGGVQPSTLSPIVDPPGGYFSSPVEILLKCSTEGASIAYTFEPGDNPHWLLYSRPIVLKSSRQLRVKAIRYGYQESREVVEVYSISGK